MTRSSLILHEMLLLSTRSKGARRIKFHPRATIITGENGTGKSCIVKSIYQCFGAEPEVIAYKWRELEVKCLIRFSVRGHEFAMLQDGNSCTLLNNRLEVQDVFHRLADLSAFWAKTCDFTLKLPNSKGKLATPAPAQIFMPFYIDQDSGWSSPWNSFLRDQNVPMARRDLLEYHVGVTTNEYYAAKSEVLEIIESMRKPKARIELLMQLLRDRDSRLSAVPFHFDINAYKAEIDRLLEYCEKLKHKEETYREQLTALQDRRVALEEQHSLALQALSEINEDYRFATEQLTQDTIQCPTCGAHYDNAFIERFSLVKDEDRLRDIAMAISEQLKSISIEIKSVSDSLDSTSREATEVQEMLSKRQGALTLQEMIESEGKRRINSVINDEINLLNADISEKQLNLNAAKKKVEAAGEKERRKTIMTRYRTLMRDYRSKLSVGDLPDSALKRLDARIQITGSEKPRAVLTYRWAIMQLVHEYSSAVFCPIVVDSPYQQDQDPTSRAKMLSLMSDELPGDVQLVLSLVDPSGLKLDGEFIHLPSKYNVLRAEEFDEVAAIIRPILKSRMEFETRLSD